MAPKMLTLRELNRATLARQLLLRRHRLTTVRALERVAGVQAQWPPSPYLGLWARVEGFHPTQLVRAVERRHAVKATVMRTTLHITSSADYLAFAGIYRERLIAGIERKLDAMGERADLAGDGERLAALAAEQPRSRTKLLAALGRPKLVIEDRQPWLVWYALSAHAGLVCAPPSSVWRSHTSGGTFVPARTWLGADGATGSAAMTHLVRRYLAAFGPASRADVSQWAGLPVSLVDDGLERLVVRRFTDESGRDLYDLPRAQLPPEDAPAPARLLPRFDNLVLSHDDRRRVLPEEYRAAVIEGGEVRAVFLVDGFVAGLWSLEGGKVRVEPFAPLPRAARREVEAEAAALEAFVRASGQA